MSYTSFVTNLAAISVTGVTRRYELDSTPPTSIGAADLPAQFVNPGGGATSGQDEIPGSANFVAYAATLMILVEAIGLSNSPANYAACVSMVDNLNTALKANCGVIDGPETGPLRWTIKEGIQGEGDSQFWAVWAEVSTGTIR